MVDGASIAAVFSALNGAKVIAEGMISLRDTQLIQQKVIELQSSILAAQNSAFSAQQERIALEKKIDELETLLSQMNDWKLQSENYMLKEVSGGAFAFVEKEGSISTGPSHWLCTKCFYEGKKALIQSEGRDKTGRIALWRCHRCQSMIQTHWSCKPGKTNGPEAV